MCIRDRKYLKKKEKERQEAVAAAAVASNDEAIVICNSDGTHVVQKPTVSGDGGGHYHHVTATTVVYSYGENHNHMHVDGASKEEQELNKQKIDTLEEKVGVMQGIVNNIQGEVTVIKGDIAHLKTQQKASRAEDPVASSDLDFTTKVQLGSETLGAKTNPSTVTTVEFPETDGSYTSGATKENDPPLGVHPSTEAGLAVPAEAPKGASLEKAVFTTREPTVRAEDGVPQLETVGPATGA